MNAAQLNEVDTSNQEARKELLDLLGFEINRLDSEQHRPGWTKWALIGAIASCVWLLLDQFESHAALINLPNALFLFLIWSLVWEALDTFKRFMGTGSPSVGRKAGFWFTNVILSEMRLLLSAKLTEKICFVAIITTCHLIPHNWIFFTAIAIFGISLFGICIVLVLSYCKFKITNDRPKYPAVFIGINLLSIVPSLLVLYGLTKVGIKNISQFTVFELRVSLLVFALSLIAPLFLMDKIHYPFLTALLDLKRKLALQEITYEFAKQQANVFFKGMEAKEALQEDVDSVLSKYRAVLAASNIVLKEAKALTFSEGHLKIEEQQLLLQPLVLQISPRLESVQKLLKEAEEAKANLKGLIFVLGWLSPSSESDMKRLFETMESSAAETKKLFLSKAKEIESILVHIKGSS